MFLSDFLNSIKRNFNLHDENQFILVIDESQGSINVTEGGLHIYMIEKKDVVIKFTNSLGNYITCTIRDLRGFIVEEYSLEELLSDEEAEYVFKFVNERFSQLRLEKLGIGFIFDPEGYSEDYIKIDYDAWGS